MADILLQPRPLSRRTEAGAICLAFFLSGGSALVLEVLWTRYFVTILGASTYAVSAVLCAFMAGLGLGSWLGGRLADRIRWRIEAYAVAQFGVAAWALALPQGLSALYGTLPALLPPGAGEIAASIGVRFLVSFAFLVVPCFLMGATLPLLSRHWIRTRGGVGTHVGALYGVNTLGAALGCFATGFWFLDTLGLRLTNMVAVGICVLAGLLALAATGARRGVPAEKRSEDGAAAAGPAEPVPESITRLRPLLPAAACLGGAAALACEVLWFRFLGPMSNLAYTFPTILGVYLVGLGAGSVLCRSLLLRGARVVPLLARSFAVLGALVVVTFTVSGLLHTGERTGPLSLWAMAVIAVLPCTVLMGMILPLICAAYARGAAHAGRDIGIVYALNTLGTVAGALMPPLVLIPLVGVEFSLFLMAATYWLLGAALARRAGVPFRPVGLTTVGVAAGAAVVVIPADVPRQMAIPPHVHLRRHRETMFYSEGRTSTEIITRDVTNDLKYLYMNGAIEVTTAAPEMMSFKMMATLGIFLHPDPSEVLMVCFGGGIASGTACQFPEVKSVTAVDLERSVIRGARCLSEENHAVYDDPKFTLAVDDGRNFLLTARRKWPVIVSDSLHPRSSDAWVLYTKEFYEAARDALTGDGVFVQWVPYQGLSEAEYRSIVRTFQDVFPHASLWFAQGIAINGLYGGHTILVGTPGPLRIDVGLLEKHLASKPVLDDLQPWGLGDAAGVLDTFICGESLLRQWAGDGPLNTDDLCYIQYETPLAAGPQCTRQSFAPLIEDPWPYLTNAGTDQKATALRADLEQRVSANKLFMSGRVSQALAALPGDPKIRNYREALAKGVEWVRKVAPFYSDDEEALSTLAFRAMEIPGNAEQAIGLFTQAAELKPDDAITQANLGYALLLDDRLDESLAHLQAAIRVNPRLASAHYNMGVVLARRGEPAQAAEAFAQAVRIDPSIAGRVPSGYLR